MANLQNIHWLKSLFTQGLHEIKIDFKRFNRSIHNGISSFEIPNGTKIKLQLDTKAFYPLKNDKQSSFHGYLINIVKYEIKSNEISLVQSDLYNECWNANKIELLNQLLKNWKKIRQVKRHTAISMGHTR